MDWRKIEELIAQWQRMESYRDTGLVLRESLARHIADNLKPEASKK